jgi:hypothetical protein
MRRPSQEMALDIVRRQWEGRAAVRPASTTLCFVRRGVAILLVLLGLVVFCQGLLADKEHGDDVADAGAYVVPAQGAEAELRACTVHAAHAAAADGAGATMKCAADQGAAP